MQPEERNLLALSLVPGIGPRLSQMLLARFGSAGRVLSATEDELQTVPHIGVTTSKQLANAFVSVPVDDEIGEMSQRGVELLISNTPGYPPALHSLSDYPPLLYVKGAYREADRRAVAIVGSRQCTAYGRKMAENIATGLCRAGFTVVSGLARGIDGAAHTAALAAGGRTIAVLAGGLSKIYPPEHRELADRVAGQGALFSETAMKLDPQRGMFHNRNRLISGLSLAVVIIEANDKSGALITARHAAEQDRPVLVVPANADSPTSLGSLRLIRDGARLVRGIDDILEDLKGLRSGAPVDLFSGDSVEVEAQLAASAIVLQPPPNLDAVSRQIWDYLEESRHIDEIARHLDKPISALSSVLMMMEMSRCVQRRPGNIYCRI